MEEVRVKNEFSSLEKIQSLIISNDDWVAKEYLTATLKKKRKVIRDAFIEEIQREY